MWRFSISVPLFLLPTGRLLTYLRAILSLLHLPHSDDSCHIIFKHGTILMFSLVLPCVHLGGKHRRWLQTEIKASCQLCFWWHESRNRRYQAFEVKRYKIFCSFANFCMPIQTYSWDPVVTFYVVSKAFAVIYVHLKVINRCYQDFMDLPK